MAGNRCQAKTKQGKQCQARPVAGSRYCFAHEPGLASQRAAWRRAGGQKSGKQTALAEAGSVQTPQAVRDLLARTIDAVQAGTMDSHTANTIGRLCSLQLKAIKDTDLAERLVALEHAVAKGRS